MIAASYSARRATDQECVRWLKFLPRQARADAEIFAVSESEEGAADGAGAVWLLPNRRFAEHARFGIHVAPESRRRGAGRALLEQIVAASRTAHAKTLVAPGVEQSSDAYAFLVASGFGVSSEMISYDLPVDRMVTGPIYKRVLARGKVPPNAKLIPLSDAPMEKVRKLVLDNLAYSSAAVAQRLVGDEHGFSRTLSTVAVIGDEVIGAVLITYQKAVAMIDALVVAPKWRFGWANVALKNAAAESLTARGVRSMRFTSSPTMHMDTTKYAKRAGAAILKRVCTMTLALT